MNTSSRKFRLLKNRDSRNQFVADQLKMFLRNQLRALRDARNMTQKELADLIGTKQSVISRLEKNVDRVSVPTMLDIARALDVVFVARFEAIDTVINFYSNPSQKKMTPRRSEEVLTELEQRGDDVQGLLDDILDGELTTTSDAGVDVITSATPAYASPLVFAVGGDIIQINQTQ